MSTETQNARTEIRDLLKDVGPEQYQKDRTRDELNADAAELGIENAEEMRTKADVVEAIVDAVNLPDPSLRGESEVDSPVARVWQFCNEHAEAINNGDLRRKDAIAQLQEIGIAFYTARTQYQAWFSATNKGERRLEELSNDELPSALQTKDEEEDSDES